MDRQNKLLSKKFKLFTMGKCLETTRHVSMITITLSKNELNTTSIGRAIMWLSLALLKFVKFVMQVKIGLRVLTRPVADELPTVYQTLGENYNERVLPSIIQETLKVVVAYKAQMEDLRSQFHGRNNMRKAKGHNGNNSNRPYHKHGLIALICGSMLYDIMTPKGEEEIQRYVLENEITNVNVHQIDQKENHLVIVLMS
ncbi:prohibitin-1, mitochondrial-like protein isoform X1 [Tanacetum coccineum]